MPTIAVEQRLARHWGRRVAAARQRSGRSQQSLAHACGVTQQTVSKVERGEMLAGDRLKWALADALDVAPGELFAWPERRGT
jgi:transcriptional regulator with XRE-family HTH domain